MFHHPRSLHLGTLLLSTALFSLGCEKYVGAPRASIEGIEQGTLADPKAPLRILFDRAIDPATLKLKVVRLVTDPEGLLGDEDSDEKTELDIVYSFDASEKFPNKGGKGTVDEAGTAISIVPKDPWPIAEKLAVLIEPGLSDAEGSRTYIARERLALTYLVKLNCAPSADFVTRQRHAAHRDAGPALGMDRRGPRDGGVQGGVRQRRSQPRPGSLQAARSELHRR